MSWATRRDHPDCVLDHLIEPSLAALDDSRWSGDLLIDATRQGGRLIAFSVIELPLKSSMPAMGIAFGHRPDVRGISKWQMAAACERLASRGIGALAIGGSESAGLDFFKRRFVPFKSVVLHSLQATAVR
jgi:hypothetical protein